MRHCTAIRPVATFIYGSRTLLAAFALQQATLGEVPESKTFPVKASQGVAVDAEHFYAISNTKIIQHDKKTGKELGRWQADRKHKSTAHFKHMNSGTVVGDKLYCAHSRFPIAPNDSTVEIFVIKKGTIQHEATIPLPKKHGSLTWIDKRKDGTWWMCYAIYGKPSNQKTKLVEYHKNKGNFVEMKEWYFPAETIARWGSMSCSGGSWGPGGKLYVTGHDLPEVSVLKLNKAGELKHLKIQAVPEIYGQAIAWDRSSPTPVLWGIIKNKQISQTPLEVKN
ncbi:MAG: hypothetical protein AB8D78_01955 [Akkermansiaceae bacterium]